MSTGAPAINRLMGSYTVPTASLTCGQVAMTMMAGPPEAMAYEQAFVAALAEPLDIVETPDGLDLAHAGEPVIRADQGPGRLTPSRGPGAGPGRTWTIRRARPCRQGRSRRA